MLTFLTYPRLVAEAPADCSRCALRRTLDVLAPILPAGSGVHVLPFGPASGDGGFASNDWMQTDPALADWTTISELADRYRLIVDGVYNHVGSGHAWVQQLRRAPYGAAARHFLTRSVDVPPDTRLGPRGEPIYRTLDAALAPILVRQTFSGAAVDLNLDDPFVRQRIDEHLRLLADRGVWGVRLDAAAYYGKTEAGPIRHNLDSIRLTAAVCEMVHAHGLQPLPQLDVDAQTRDYDAALGGNVILSDLAFPSILNAALHTGRPEMLVEHCAATGVRGYRAFRALRTHDGVLLRSASIDAGHLAALTELAKGNGFMLRVTSDSPYELNASGPALARAHFATDPYLVVLLGVALTAFLSQQPYIYMPTALNWEPESLGPADENEDPRQLNRRPVPASHLRVALERHLPRLEGLLASLKPVEGAWAQVLMPELECHGSVLEVRLPGIRLWANCSSRPTAWPAAASSVSFRSVDGPGLAPYEIVIVRNC